jgi:hypothetical protein
MATATTMVRCRSHCSHCHCPRHCRLIAMSKRWAMATAAAMAALRAMALGDCGGSSSDDGGCHDSRGKDNGDGGNGIGDNFPCHPCHCPLHHPPHRCHCQHPCCDERVTARAARAMMTAKKRAMVRRMRARAARAKATATRVLVKGWQRQQRGQWQQQQGWWAMKRALATEMQLQQQRG